MPKIFISTIPFASTNKASLELLEEHSIDYEINPLGRKVSEKEITDYVKNIDGLIAGTEPLGKSVLANAEKLKVISRVGVGTDNIDLNYAKSKNISIEITNQGPTNSVAEHTIALILNALKGIHISSSKLKSGIWEKALGREITECVIGIIGVGNIGKRVIELLSAFNPAGIYYYDPYTSLHESKAIKVEFNDLLKLSDVVSLHLPLTDDSLSLISNEELDLMKKNALLVNTSRGAVIDEDALVTALQNDSIGGAALDVFLKEPYIGRLTEFDNCLLTPHIAPMTVKARESMEYDAVKNLIKHLTV
jgi:D-3-phosphoglycerate dehydrogenase